MLSKVSPQSKMFLLINANVAGSMFDDSTQQTINLRMKLRKLKMLQNYMPCQFA